MESLRKAYPHEQNITFHNVRTLGQEILGRDDIPIYEIVSAFEQYLTEALFCISGYIAQHRYEATRALAYKIREYAKDSEIVMMIDQASSPTFFLAECVSTIKKNGRDVEEQGIGMRFYQRLQDMFSDLYDDFTDLTIIDKYNNEYL